MIIEYEKSNVSVRRLFIYNIVVEKNDLSLNQVIRSIEKVYPSTGKMIWRSFLHGLFTALGATIGLAIVISIVTYIITKANFIPREYRQGIEQVLPEDR